MATILEQGSITSQADAREHAYRIQVLDQGCLAELSAFQQKTYDQMPDKRLYAPIGDAMFRAVLGEQGITLGLVLGEQLHGFVCFYFPGDDKENLGRDAGLCGQELKQVVHWERCLIAPEFRGNNMQFRMGELLVKATAAYNRTHRYMCATVAPNNYPSLHQLFEQQQMVAVNLKKKYGDLWRLVFFKDIQQPFHASPDDVVAVDCTDLERQLDLFQQGYYAFQVLLENDGVKTLFSKNCFKMVC